MSIEKKVQAMCRATYQHSRLEDNGTILTHASDFDMAQAYSRWLKEMQGRRCQRLAASAKCSDSSNFAACQRQSVGNQSIDSLSMEISFSAHVPGKRPGRRWLDMRMQSDSVASKVLELARKHAECFDDKLTVVMTARNYCEECNNVLSEEEASSLHVSSCLTRLVMNGIMKKSQGKPAGYWLTRSELRG
eukprot:749536-Hanusia_phi.AAC.6